MSGNNTKNITLSYIRGTSEATERLLNPSDIRINYKPIEILRSTLFSGTDRADHHDQSGPVHSFRCHSYHASLGSDKTRRDRQATTHPCTLTQQADPRSQIWNHWAHTVHEVKIDSVKAIDRAEKKGTFGPWSAPFDELVQLTRRNRYTWRHPGKAKRHMMEKRTDAQHTIPCGTGHSNHLRFMTSPNLDRNVTINNSLLTVRRYIYIYPSVYELSGKRENKLCGALRPCFLFRAAFPHPRLSLGDPGILEVVR